MVRVDVICGYLVSPEQRRVFANAQGIRYDPGGDLALLHSGVRRWAEGHKLILLHPRYGGMPQLDLTLFTLDEVLAQIFQQISGYIWCINY